MASSTEREPPQRTILITGAGGFIGRRLVTRLAQNPAHHVRALIRRQPDRSVPSVQWIQGDLLSPTTYESHLAGVDVVIHLAAAVGRCPPDQYFATNYRATEHLLEHCRAAGVARFLFVSTIAVRFSRLETYPYAESKRLAEQSVRNSGMAFQIVRPTIVVGHDGPNWRTLLRLATLPITPIFGPGTNRLQPIDADDLVDCLADLGTDPTNESVIELGGPDVVTMNEFLERIHRQNSAKPFRPWHLPLRAIRGVIGGLESVAGHRLPLTRGQLSVFDNDSTVRPSRFHDDRQSRLRSLDEIIARASSSADEVFEISAARQQECETFSRYLVARPPSENVQRGYLRAHEQGVVAESKASPWDLRMVALARRHRWLCQGIDSYCRFLAPRSLLQRKLVLLLALWEFEPQASDDFQLKRPVPAAWIGVRIGGRLIACGLLALVAAGFLVPLKLFTPRGTPGGMSGG